MNFTAEELHDLVGALSRLNAILSLVRDPQSLATLDQAQLDRDAITALKKFEAIWAQGQERASLS